jgi:arylsulfatase A-like enzyme
MAFLLITLLLPHAISATTTTEKPPSSASSPPNIVVILADDLGYNDVSWHNERIISPHLESLARDGLILENAYVQPICTPTR